MSPIKMFEYMASGVPIIASDLPALREVLQDGKNCLLAAPSDVTAWLIALDKLLQNPSLARAIGQRGHEDYEREYTWTRRAQRILSAAESIG
jgi:glycosyltransferase involved in cell wall biosynthesis